MLSKITVGAALSLGVLVGLSSAAAADFVLSCQGGGGMTFDISNVGKRARLEVVMARAATTTPGPGECTWLDRPLNADEPTRLHIEEQGSVQAACNAQGQCNIGQTTKHILAIINAIRGSGAFFVHVHNNNSGYLEISQVGK